MTNIKSSFVHLRVRSSYSLSEGACRIHDLVSAVRSNRQPAIAITDRANIYGAFEFSKISSSKGIQPILGATLSVVVGPKNSSDKKLDDVLLLCKDRIGYQSLCKLLSSAHLNPAHDAKPSISEETLNINSDGLICLWGGRESLAFSLLRRSSAPTELLSYVERLSDAFGNRLYTEIQRLGEPHESIVEARILHIAYKYDLPIVATNDVLFIRNDDHAAHDVLTCIGGGHYAATQDRPRVNKEHYLKTSDEMRNIFSDLPEAIENTIVIARRCAYMMESSPPLMPKFPLPDGMSASDALREECYQGFRGRYEALVSRVGIKQAEDLKSTYQARIEYELSVIIKMGFEGYYLIVSDFMKWASSQRIPVGVRGSGAASIVAWCLHITHLDPIRFNLVFERFLNPERVSLPDFDVDFCQDRRSEVISYVQRKYGRDNVAQIITFGTLQAKAVVRDVGRVLGVPFPVVDRLCKLIGDAPNIETAMKGEPAIAAEIESNSIVNDVIEIGKRLEGLHRHASTHAAGVVIADRPLTEILPLYRDPSSEMPVTQFNFKDAEKIGLVKFDFLGLRTLTIIAKAVEVIEQEFGISLDVLDLDFSDSNVFDIITRGDVSGIFQLESSGMKDLLRKLQPEKIEQLIALISLYRPGPMDSIPTYIARSKGREPVVYDHEMLQGVLSETYGVITYQEDVMQIARDMAGYSLGEADLLRRAMGKKIASEMEAHRKTFLENAETRGVDRQIAEKIFSKCEKFAGYGFNKSHAAAYAQVSYQTGYLKFYYLHEFYLACMNVDYDQIDRLKTYCAELKVRGVEVLPPSVNRSKACFAIEYKDERKCIRYGLAALKGVGMGISECIMKEREAVGDYTSPSNFFSRVASYGLNRATAEKLVKAGALDDLIPNRKFMLQELPKYLRDGAVVAKEVNTGQSALFGEIHNDHLIVNKTGILDGPYVSRSDLLKDELSSIGFYMSGHPLDFYEDVRLASGMSSLENLMAGKQGSSPFVAVLIDDVQRRRSKKSGNPYAFVTISDSTASVEAIAFSHIIQDSGELIVPGEMVLASISVENDEGTQRAMLTGVKPLDYALRKLESINIKIDESKSFVEKQLASFKEVVDSLHSGTCTLFLEMFLSDKNLTAVIMLKNNIKIDAESVARLAQFGDVNFKSDKISLVY